MTAFEQAVRKVECRFGVFCCQPPFSNADFQVIVAKRNALAQLDRTSTASPIWGICKSSVCHENQPVDIREADAVVNANFPISILSIGTTGDESISTYALNGRTIMNALPETLTASMTKVFGLFPLSATARSRSGTLVGQAWSWPMLITLWCDSTEA